MAMKLLLAAAAGFVLLPLAAARAQEPPPLELHLVRDGATYRLEFDDEFGAVDAYQVDAHVSAIGSDSGVITTLSAGDDDAFSLTLPPLLDGMRDEGCYRVGFGVRTDPGLNKPAGPTVASLDTRACVDAAGAMSFPAFDGIDSPPPVPPSDVRVERRGDDWTITWRDNSADEIAFQAGMSLFPDGPGYASVISMPDVPANWTAAGGLMFFGFRDLPPPVGCGTAWVIVFSLGGDHPSLLPGNVMLSYCWDGSALDFPTTALPDTGDGRPPRDLALPIALLLTLGATTAVLGAGFIRPRAGRSS